MVATLLINLLAFMVALVLTRGINGHERVPHDLFVPNLIGGIVLGYIWQILINCVPRWWAAFAGAEHPAGYWGPDHSGWPGSRWAT